MASRLARGVATTEKAPFKAQAQGIIPLSRGSRFSPKGKKNPRGREASAAQAPRKRHLAGRDQESKRLKVPSSKAKVRRNHTPRARPAGFRISLGSRRKLPEIQLPKPEKTSMAQRTSEKAMVRSPRK